MAGEALTRRAAAYHEAGHAVVAAEVGYEVYEIYVGTPGTGRVQFRYNPADEQTQDGRGRLLSVDVAGRIAQSIALDEACDIVASFFGGVRSILETVGLDIGRDHALASCIEGDDFDVAMHLRACSYQEMCAELSAARDAAQSILEDRWRDVESIASCMGGDARETPAAGPL